MSESTPKRRDLRKKNKRKKSGVRRFFKGLGVFVLVLLVVVSAAGVYLVRSPFAKTNGEVQIAGLEERVSVERDDFGIPTITAKSAHDLFMAQGFIHASDRFWEMDFRRHLTSARLSELFGESQVGTDKFLRSLNWHGIAEEEVAALPKETLAYYEAYAAGVNAYLSSTNWSSRSLEYSILKLQNPDYEPEPWVPADSVAWLKAMAWDLRTNIEDETNRALLGQTLSEEELEELYPAYPFDRHPTIDKTDWGEVTSAEAGADSAAEADAKDSDAKDSDAKDSEAAKDGETSNDGEDAIAASENVYDWGQAVRVSQELSSVLASVESVIGVKGEGIGSNSWVVAGEHTVTGQPILANDPHLGAELPSVWVQMQLRCEDVGSSCPFNVAGFSFSGLPGIVIGHNDEVAWGFTNLTTDVADLYVEVLDGDNYLQDGKKLPLQKRTETIRVAGGEDVTFEVRETHHGPIISGLTLDFTAISENPVVATESTDSSDNADLSAQVPEGEYAVALQWTALEKSTTPEAIFKLNSARNFEDFRQAASLFDVPAQNLIYADKAGNIGYQAPGKLPIRGLGDGWLPQQGWNSEYDWQGFIPFEEQPYVYNPEEGYIVTANNAIVTDEYPYFLSRDWDYGYRAARIEALLTGAIAAGKVSTADMTKLQMDNEHPAAKALQRAYKGVLQSGDGLNDGTASALEMLLAWNGQNDADSAAAAFANVLWNAVTKEIVSSASVEIPRDSQSRFSVFFENLLKDRSSKWWGGSMAETLTRAANSAHAEITELQGADPEGWSWGKLHALPLTHGTFGSSGVKPIEMLFNRGPIVTGGGASVVNATGWSLDEGYATSTVPSFRMVIDVSDWDASTWQNLTGQSGHAFNKHYVDQAENWATGEAQPWLFSAERVTQGATASLTLVPAG